MKKVFIISAIVVIFVLILNYIESSFTFKKFWIVNHTSQDVSIKILSTKGEEGITNIFGVSGICDCSKSFSEAIQPIKPVNYKYILTPKKCMEVGLCESSKTTLEKILREYHHNLDTMTIYIGDSVLNISPNTLSEYFVTEDGDNFVLNIKK